MTSRTAVSLGREYFTPLQHHWWRWSGSRCSEIEWKISDSPVIAFRQEITAVLEILQPGGWPEFQSVLLIIAACRENWPEHRDRLRAHIIHNWSPEVFERLLKGLDAVHALPKARRDTPAAKADLIRFVLGDVREWFTPDDARLALIYFKTIFPLRDPADFIEEVAHSASRREWIGEERIRLLHGLSRLTATTLELRQETGLERLLLPAPIPELDTKETVKTHAARLSEWLDDPDLGGIARIARRLIPVLSVLRPITDPDEMPMGGVSDLSNRGELHQLLLSELAHDDDTLATRVALREALYLRRECATSPSNRQQRILVDAGVRMWGVPRVYGASVALALAATEDSRPELTVEVSVTDLDGPRTVGINSRSGVVSLLSALSPRATPTEDLGSWLPRKSSSNHRATLTEYVIITSFEAGENADFRAGLGEIPQHEYTLALVDREGRLEIRRHTLHGERLVQSLRLDLEELLTPPAKSRAREDALITPGGDLFPAIMRVQPFPLRLSHEIREHAAWPVGSEGLISLGANRRLLYWDKSGRGGIELMNEVPTGRVIAWRTPWNRIPAHVRDKLEPQNTWGLIANPSGWWLLQVDLAELTVTTCKLESHFKPGDQSVTGLICPEAVYLLREQPGVIEAFSLSTGSRLAQLNAGCFGFFGNRYLMLGHKFHRMALMAQTIHLQEMDHSPSDRMILDLSNHVRNVSSYASIKKKSPLNHQIFDGHREFGTLAFNARIVSGMHQHGELLIINGEFHPSANNPKITPGTRTIITNLNEETPTWRAFDLPLDKALQRFLELRLYPQRFLRHRFPQLGISREAIWLQSTTKNWWRFQFNHQGGRLLLEKAPPPEMTILDLQELQWHGCSVQFRSTQLPNGTTLLLDSRGLMHVIPRDSKGEATIVLDEKQLSGWFSDGTLWGSPYYTNQETSPDPQTIWWTRLAPMLGVRP